MLTDEEKLVIRCAYADLLGSLQNYEQQSYSEHDWDAHRTTLQEMETTFDFLNNDIPKNREDD